MSVTTVVGGWVPRAPETGVTKSGKTKSTFNICAFGPKDSNFWIKVMVFEDRLDKVMAFIKPGSRILVTGSLQKPSARLGKEGVPIVDVTLFATGITMLPSGTGERREGPKVENEDTHLRKQMGGAEESDDLPF